MPVEIRSFRRGDRDQLTALVNAHVAAVVPGASVSVNAVLAQLEREPGEFIVDPWVVARATIVAEQRGRVVAAAHLLRYGASDSVGESYRDAAEIRWLLCGVDAPFWPDATEVGIRLTAAAVERLRAWRPARILSDASLPAPGVYGVPDQWPHIAALLEDAGFRSGRTEVVLLARISDLPRVAPPLAGLRAQRSVGINGTRLAAVLDGHQLGFIEVDSRAGNGRDPRLREWADVGNLHVDEEWRRRGVATWLVGAAGEWLELGGFSRLLDYAQEDEEVALEFLQSVGFRELTRTRRGWTLEP